MILGYWREMQSVADLGMTRLGCRPSSQVVGGRCPLLARMTSRMRPPSAHRPAPAWPDRPAPPPDRGGTAPPASAHPHAMPVRDADLQDLLAAARRAEVGNCSVRTDQVQQSLDEPGPVLQRHAQGDFQRQTDLYRSVAELAQPAAPARWFRLPHHLGIEPGSSANHDD